MKKTFEKPEIVSVGWLKKCLREVPDDTFIFIAHRQKSGKVDLTEITPIRALSYETIDGTTIATIFCGDE